MKGERSETGDMMLFEAHLLFGSVLFWDIGGSRLAHSLKPRQEVLQGE